MNVRWSDHSVGEKVSMIVCGLIIATIIITWIYIALTGAIR